MTIRILFFASLAQRLGAAESSVQLPDGSTVRDAYRTLTARHPCLAEAADNLAFAVNMVYVDARHTLRDGDELALIPPVSGG